MGSCSCFPSLLQIKRSEKLSYYAISYIAYRVIYGWIKRRRENKIVVIKTKQEYNRKDEIHGEKKENKNCKYYMVFNFRVNNNIVWNKKL